ncbi:MAG: hypothetical protein E7620_07490, partial [Ruminococcaceae bacterium]|nr:hypothetical protein [Oscillospiraceae bacterium]
MKKIGLTLVSVLVILVITTMLFGATISANAEVIPIPDIPAIDRPYQTIEELGIDFDAIDAHFPHQIEVKRENGKVYVEDIGAGFVSVFAADYYELALIDGYWTGDIEGELQVIHFYHSNPFEFEEARYWNIAYYGDGTRDSYIHLKDDTRSMSISFANEYQNVTVLYRSGDYNYEDTYLGGVLVTHGVSNRKDTDLVEVLYDMNGNIKYCEVLTNTYYFYFPGQGWSSTWDSFTEGDVPEGYEGIDETYFTVNKPSLICNAAGGDSMLHEMSTAYCTSPATCKNGCGHTEGTIEHHTWQTVDGEK